MKHPVGYAKPRRLATPRKQVQLHLRQRQAPKPEDERETKQKSTFWKWVILVTLFHIVAIGLIYVIYEATPAPPPPEQFISLLPQGDVVKGTPGTQEAHKVGPTTPAPSVHHTSAPPEAVQSPKPVVKPPPTPAKPVIEKADAPTINSDKPITPKPAPVKPKVKVDLTLADGPTPNTVKHAIKPKPHVKKPVVKTTPDEANPPDTAGTSSPDSSGLSKEEIAAKLGEKLKQAGIDSATKTGQSGSENAKPNDFADFYDAIRDQVMNKWTSPNLTDETAVNPIVRIHVEKDGRVPPESVTLIQSSGNATYDDSAVAAAKGLGYLYEPLPDGCPPDIPITFKLTR